MRGCDASSLGWLEVPLFYTHLLRHVNHNSQGRLAIQVLRVKEAVWTLESGDLRMDNQLQALGDPCMNGWTSNWPGSVVDSLD